MNSLRATYLHSNFYCVEGMRNHVRHDTRTYSRNHINLAEAQPYMTFDKCILWLVDRLRCFTPQTFMAFKYLNGDLIILCEISYLFFFLRLCGL